MNNVKMIHKPNVFKLRKKYNTKIKYVYEAYDILTTYSDEGLESTLQSILIENEEYTQAQIDKICEDAE